jgi:hypothetical protein|tara:strand:- start:684 stop:950 length:267 start_codon:yes stop_codon:yes gene_type:complete
LDGLVDRFRLLIAAIMLLGYWLDATVCVRWAVGVEEAQMKKTYLYLGLVRVILLLASDICRLVFWLHVIAGLAINYKGRIGSKLPIPV